MTRTGSRVRIGRTAAAAVVAALALVPGEWVGVLAAGEAEGAAFGLREAVETARRNSPSVKVAAQRMRAARADLRGARGARSPRLDVETGYAVTDNPPAAFMSLLNQRQLRFDTDFNHPDATDNWGSGLRGEWVLYSGGAVEAAIEAAERGVAATGLEAEGVRRALDLQVALGFFEILRVEAVLEAAVASRESRRSHLDLARRLVEARTALETDVLDLDVQLQEAEMQVVRAVNERRARMSRFATLLGLDETDSVAVRDAGAALEDPADVAAATRPELLAFSERARQAEAEARRAGAGRLPQVNAFGDLRHDEGFTEPGGGDSWTVGVGVRLNLWDGRRTAARVEAAEAAAEEIREEERKRRLEIRHEVAAARLALETARQGIALAESALRSAERSLELNGTRFEQGLVLSTQLIDSESARTSARVRLANARFEERMAVAALRHAIGLDVVALETPTDETADR